MLILLPLLALSVASLLFLGRASKDSSLDSDWRGALLRGSVVWALFLVVVSEGLGLLNAINATWLALVWGLALLTLIGIGQRTGWLKSGWEIASRVRLPRNTRDRILLGGILLIVAMLLLVAIISPPNNVDSFVYHMSRVVHWAQNQSLDHYPAAQDHQLLKPPWAELAILHLRVLWGSDRPANLVQWFSMVGSLIGISKIADLLGAKLRGQLAASAFAVTVPMGIMQATSTQNDYVVAYWSVVLAYFVVSGTRRRLDPLGSVLIAGTAAIGILTKGTFYVYCIPVLVWHLLSSLRNEGLRRATERSLLIGMAIVVINLGFWARNVSTFGGPYGSSDWLQANLFVRLPFMGVSAPAEEQDPDLSSSDQLSTELRDLADGFLDGAESIARRELHMVGRNFNTPVGVIQRPISKLLRLTPIYGEQYATEIDGAAWNHEDTAGNLIHLLLVPISIGTLAAARSFRNPPQVLGYTLTVLGTYALVPIIIGHGATSWAVRYQLPFFVLWGALFGRGFGALGRGTIALLASFALLIVSLPWLLLNNTRPVIGLPPWPTATGSIFTTDPAEVLFATNASLRDDYSDMTSIVKRSGCQSVGLRIETDDFDYPFWWLLGAPESGIRIEVINVEDRMWKHIDTPFEPCAVICSICENQIRFRELDRIAQSDSMSLFMDHASQLEQ